MSALTPAWVVGGTGYVAGELLRLIAQHSGLRLAGVSSESQAGTPVSDAFPHLAPCLQDEAGAPLRFLSQDELMEAVAAAGAARHAIFSAAPHVVSAGVIARILAFADQRKIPVSLVDVSSDFRFRQPADFEAVYRQPHGAPELLDQFVCAMPEHVQGVPARYVGHPGCFASAMLAGMVPLLSLGLVEPVIYATGITGSTGAGRTPLPTTHHPERHSNLFAYNPLKHRHAPEVVKICEQLTGTAPELNFVPHSGPFSRGIHMTLQARLAKPATTAEVLSALTGFYAHSHFVRVVEGMPRVKDVAGSNYCHVGATVSGSTVAVMVAIDNLVKGAAGGAVQWMNRLLGLPETAGLTAPAPGWI